MERDYTTVNLSIRHYKILSRIAEKNRRDIKAQLEIFVEEGARSEAVA